MKYQVKKSVLDYIALEIPNLSFKVLSITTHKYVDLSACFPQIINNNFLFKQAALRPSFDFSVVINSTTFAFYFDQVVFNISYKKQLYTLLDKMINDKKVHISLSDYMYLKSNIKFAII